MSELKRISASFEELNEAQREAVMFEGPGPLLVLAGPGSGKTFVITRRIQYLLKARGVPPERILVLTFTKDAALSMQRRFQELQSDSKAVNFGTFHSVFYQILKKSSGIKDCQLLTDVDKQRLLSSVLKNYLQKTADFRRFSICSELIKTISYYKNTKSLEFSHSTLPSEIREHFEEIYGQYEKQRRDMGKLDFDDMLEDCRKMLEENEVMRQFWQSRFDYILIDEFQDINPAQYEVIRLLARPPYQIFAVGDDDQAIYGFRGSDPSCMQRFVKEYSAKQIALIVNYRSLPEIVKASHFVIQENKNRFSKDQNSFQSLEKGEVSVQKFISRKEEIESMVRQCKGQGECAILFRTNRLMQTFALELKRRKIPYEMRERQQNPYENGVALDLLAYLKLAKGQESTDLVMRILNKPVRYVSREVTATRKTIGELKEYYQTANTGVYEQLLRLEKDLAFLRRLSPFPGVQYIRKAMGYEAWLLDFYREDKIGREEAMLTLQWLSEDASNYHDLGEWLDFQKECGRGNFGAKEKAAFSLMTVHAAKGLEFDTVFMPDCNDRIYPYGNLLSDREVEEERRIFYVGMTRAKRRLYLFYVAGTKEYPEQPSRFLKKIFKNKAV